MRDSAASAGCDAANASDDTRSARTDLGLLLTNASHSGRSAMQWWHQSACTHITTGAAAFHCRTQAIYLLCVPSFSPSI
jgi:hypothetical protein